MAALTNLLGLDISFEAEPFVQVTTAAGLDPNTLDFVFRGEPFSFLDTAGNILFNGDFELSATLPPDGWSLNSAHATLSWGAAPYAGTRSIRAVSDGTGSQVLLHTNVSGEFPVVPGQQYLISGACKRNSGSGSHQIGLWLTAADGGYLANATTSPNPSTSWVPFSSTVTIPATQPLTLTNVTVSSGNAVYTYSSSFYPSASRIIGQTLVVTGFATGGNNVSATITAIDTVGKTFTVVATTQVDETHAASGTFTIPVATADFSCCINNTNDVEFDNLSVVLVTATSGTSGTALPAGVSMSATVGTATVSGEANVTPTGVSLTVTQHSPTGSGAATVTPTGQSLTAAIHAPTGSGAASVAATGQALTSGIHAPTGSGAGTALPSGVSLTAAVGTATATTSSGVSGTATPAGVSMTSAVGTATASVSVTATPTGVSMTSAVHAPTVSVSVTALPSGLNTVTTVGIVTATGAGKASPLGVSITSAVGTATPITFVYALPAGVSMVSHVGTATVSVTVTPPVAVSTNLRTWTGNANAGYAVFTLVGFGKESPRVSGLAACVLSTTQIKVVADVNGVLTANLMSNDTITPAGTSYEVTVYTTEGGFIQSGRYRLTSGNVDLSTLTSL